MPRTFIRREQCATAFSHLERAHVLGQENIRAHVASHWLMLVVAVKQRAPLAALGQVARIVLGLIGSALGAVPTGNTGGSNTSMFMRLPIEPELLAIMRGEPFTRLAP